MEPQDSYQGFSPSTYGAPPAYAPPVDAVPVVPVPQLRPLSTGEVLDRTIRVRFDGNVDHGLPWTFAPVQQTMDVKIGETALAFFKATNETSAPVSGTAIFNVAPELASRYFTKIECFCFKQQTLAGGQSVEMPVTFFVDPKIVDDEDTKNMSEITLSYTFYRADKDAAKAASTSGGDGSRS